MFVVSAETSLDSTCSVCYTNSNLASGNQEAKQTQTIFWLFLLSFLVRLFVEVGGVGRGRARRCLEHVLGFCFFHFFFGKLVSLVLLNGKICLNWRNGVSCKYCRAGQARVHGLKITQNFLRFQVVGCEVTLKY